MIKTFVSYHHANDQNYKNIFTDWATRCGLIQDMSVGTNEVDENLPTQSIRKLIRDNYLRDSQVTVLLCGTETRYRKHVDWELKSSMIDGTINRQSGILVIKLPTIDCSSWQTAFHGEAEIIYPDYTGTWQTLQTKAELTELHPNLPGRIVENLNTSQVKISVVPWERVFGHPDRLKFLLENTALAGKLNQYDLSRPMRMKNYNPKTDYVDFRV